MNWKFLTHKTISDVKALLNTPVRREKMVNTNYEIAAQYYAYAVLRRWLNILLTNFFGTEQSHTGTSSSDPI